MCAGRNVCSGMSEESQQSMALDHGVVGVGTGSDALLVGPMIFRNVGDVR